LPYHFTVWTIPNSPESLTWEECFDLPTAHLDAAALTQKDIVDGQKALLSRFASLPGVRESLPPDLLASWLNLKFPNRTLGPCVIGCSALIAYEILLNALKAGGVPLPQAPIHYAPWLVLYDVRRNVGYEYNFREKRIRWRHPLTGQTFEENAK
jgi:hypothetical protein